jgi:putative endonuclease
MPTNSRSPAFKSLGYVWFVYLLKSEHGEFYIGFTSDLERRIQAHNDGLNRSTRGRPWRLAYCEMYTSEAAARDRERILKHDGRSRRALMERVTRHLE